MAEDLDDARDAFAQEIPQASRQRDQSGRFVATSGKPEPILQPRELEGDPLTGDTSDGGDDPRLVEHERRVADGRSEEGDEDRGRVSQSKGAGSAAADQGDDDAADGERQVGRRQEADAAGQDVEKPDQGAGAEQEVADDSPRYRITVDGQEREVSLNEALRGYTREETFNSRMARMVEVAKAIDQRGAEATQARDAYIALCRNQEQEFAALIPAEPANWEELYRANPAAAHQLENNYKAVYGTLNAIRQRRFQAEQQAVNENAQRAAGFARAEFDKFKQKNKLEDQAALDRAIGFMRRTALEAGFTEDEISTTYDERMLSVLHKAARFDNMMRNKPIPVQPERGSALTPGSAPRIGNGAMRTMNDAQRRLAASGRVDDAALVMAQFLRPRQ